jgi:hypothetical protein
VFKVALNTKTEYPHSPKKDLLGFMLSLPYPRLPGLPFCTLVHEAKTKTLKVQQVITTISIDFLFLFKIVVKYM